MLRLVTFLRRKFALASITTLVIGGFSVWASLPDTDKIRYIGKIEDAFISRIWPPDERFKVLEAGNADVVFVIDITVSMLPFLNSLRDYLEELNERPVREESFYRYSVVTFADDPVPPRIVVDLDTPASSRSVDLAEQKVAAESNRGFAERAFDAVTFAASASAWPPESNRIIVLITDAPSREHSNGYSEEEIIAILAERRVFFSTVYLGRHLTGENPYGRLCAGINYSMRGDCLNTQRLDYFKALESVLRAFSAKVGRGSG